MMMNPWDNVLRQRTNRQGLGRPDFPIDIPDERPDSMGMGVPRMPMQSIMDRPMMNEPMQSSRIPRPIMPSRIPRPMQPTRTPRPIVPPRIPRPVMEPLPMRPMMDQEISPYRRTMNMLPTRNRIMR